MKTKKLLSAVMATAMAVSAMSVSVSAVEANKSYTIDTAYTEFEINATIPATPVAFINPYKAAIKLDADGLDLTSTVEQSSDSTFTSGVVSPTYKIENADESFKLAVSATPVIKAGTGISVSTKEIKSTATDKMVFAYLNTTTLVDGTNPIFRDTSYVGSSSQAMFAEDAKKKENIMTIAEAPSDSATSVGYFRVEGDSTPSPEKAWTTADKVTLTLILDLIPTKGEAKDLTLTGKATIGATADNITIEAGKATYDVTLTAATTVATVKATLSDADSDGTNAQTAVKMSINGGALVAGTVTTAGAVTFTGTTAIDNGDVVELIIMGADKTTKTYTFNITVTAP